MLVIDPRTIATSPGKAGIGGATGLGGGSRGGGGLLGLRRLGGGGGGGEGCGDGFFFNDVVELLVLYPSTSFLRKSEHSQ